MPKKDDLVPDCKKIEEALKNSVNAFGEHASRLLQRQLEGKYHTRFEPPCSWVEQIGTALVDIAGPAADLIISRMRSFMR